MPTDSPKPPIAREVPHTLQTHGVRREDPYYWLRDDARTSPEVLAHLRAEADYAQAQLAPLEDLRTELYDEIVARIPKDDSSVPYFLDGYWYYSRVEKDREYAVHCRRRGTLEAAEQIILDENLRAEGHDYYATGALSVSVDGKTLAYAEDTVSRRIYSIRFRDLDSGRDHEEVLQGTSGALVWALDHRTLFYVKRDPSTLRAHQVFRHVLGTPQAQDVLVYDEQDEEFYVGIARSRSRDFVLIGSYQTLSHEYRTVDARKPDSAPVVVLPREAEHEYDVDHAHGRFYIRTNWQARDFRLMSVEPRDSADKRKWKVEIPARQGVLLTEFELFQDHLVLGERRGGLSRLRVIPWRDRDAAHEIEFEESAYYSSIDNNPDFASGTLRFHYTSMTTPPSTYDYDMNARTRELKKRVRVEGDFDPSRYATARIEVPARDGVQVPVSLVYRKDLDRSRPQPLLLYGYGSYGYAVDPRFSSARLSLLDRGMIFAMAHVRGGQELGRAWYDDGKLLHKLNSFHDFIDCAEHLVRQGWTRSDQLFALGGSAGGLLVAAVANMRPELFHGVVADVPFVDVVTTMLDESIPLTTFEYDEWGNPNRREYFDYMLKYSPYDNVKAQAYPHMLVLTGLHDSQVQYWEPAKWVARLRATKTDDRPLIFHVNMEAGHGGASGRFRQHEETAMIYAFLLSRAGLAQ
jgi:oligopeptidase B